MKTERFLIVGGGFLAGILQPFLENRGHEVVVLDFPEVDITSLANLRENISEHRPSHIINAAAFTDTRAAELAENASKVFHINVQGPVNIQCVCREKDIPMTHISTGMIFDNSPEGSDGWLEDSKPMPRSYYTWTKLWADQLLLANTDVRTLILRIHTPISVVSSPKNLLTKLRNFTSAVDEAGSITVLEDLCRAFETLRSEGNYGIFHVANPGTISMFGISQQLQEAELIPFDREITPTTYSEINQAGRENGAAYQPRIILNTSKLQAAGINLPPIWERIGEIIDEMSSHND